VQILHGICRRNLHALGAPAGLSDPPSEPTTE
jgi:hypothetical protein